MWLHLHTPRRCHLWEPRILQTRTNACGRKDKKITAGRRLFSIIRQHSRDFSQRRARELCPTAIWRPSARLWCGSASPLVFPVPCPEYFQFVYWPLPALGGLWSALPSTLLADMVHFPLGLSGRLRDADDVDGAGATGAPIVLSGTPLTRPLPVFPLDRPTLGADYR